MAIWSRHGHLERGCLISSRGRVECAAPRDHLNAAYHHHQGFTSRRRSAFSSSRAHRVQDVARDGRRFEDQIQI